MIGSQSQQSQSQTSSSQFSPIAIRVLRNRQKAAEARDQQQSQSQSVTRVRGKGFNPNTHQDRVPLVLGLGRFSSSLGNYNEFVIAIPSCDHQTQSQKESSESSDPSNSYLVLSHCRTFIECQEGRRGPSSWPSCVYTLIQRSYVAGAEKTESSKDDIEASLETQQLLTNYGRKVSGIDRRQASKGQFDVLMKRNSSESSEDSDEPSERILFHFNDEVGNLLIKGMVQPSKGQAALMGLRNAGQGFGLRNNVQDQEQQTDTQQEQIKTSTQTSSTTISSKSTTSDSDDNAQVIFEVPEANNQYDDGTERKNVRKKREIQEQIQQQQQLQSQSTSSGPPHQFLPFAGSLRYPKISRHLQIFNTENIQPIPVETVPLLSLTDDKGASESNKSIKDQNDHNHNNIQFGPLLSSEPNLDLQIERMLVYNGLQMQILSPWTAGDSKIQGQGLELFVEEQNVGWANVRGMFKRGGSQSKQDSKLVQQNQEYQAQIIQDQQQTFDSESSEYQQAQQLSSSEYAAPKSSKSSSVKGVGKIDIAQSNQFPKPEYHNLNGNTNLNSAQSQQSIKKFSYQGGVVETESQYQSQSGLKGLDQIDETEDSTDTVTQTVTQQYNQKQQSKPDSDHHPDSKILSFDDAQLHEQNLEKQRAKRKRDEERMMKEIERNKIKRGIPVVKQKVQEKVDTDSNTESDSDSGKVSGFPWHLSLDIDGEEDLQ